MCCRTLVQPLDVQLAVLTLTIGRFQPVYWLPNQPNYAVRWERQVPEEAAVVTASLTSDSLELSIAPAISIFAHHAGKRISAGIYFEIAAKYAEKVGGVILQRATVDGCRDSDATQELLLARYPELPLSFERVCAGFRSVILGEAA